MPDDPENVTEEVETEPETGIRCLMMLEKREDGWHFGLRCG